MRRAALLILFGLTIGFGQEKSLTVKEITDRVQKRYDSITDAVAQFTQQVKFGFSKIEQSFTGTLTMKKPNSYRIESELQTLITDGTTVWAYSPVNKQVLIDHFKENQNSLSPQNFLLNLPSDYYATLLGKEKKMIVLKLVPKDDQSFVKSLKAWIEEGSWIVRKVEVIDVNDTETTYTVREVQLNAHVKDNAFTFTPPPGTEVVDLR